MKAILMLEDGTAFNGEAFGAEGEAAGEVIFNTQVVGFQEILTDPAYRGQLVAMGYPHVGNVGINANSWESDDAQAAALIVKEYSKIYSNWQGECSLGDFMKKHKIIGLEGIDTRSLTVHIRDKGEMKGIVSTKDFNQESLLKKAKGYVSTNFQPQTSNLKMNLKTPITLINLGVNKSTLAKYPGAKVLSAEATAEQILAGEPEQVIISSGPGDPTKMTVLIGEIKKLIGRVPIYGIQKGGCVLALALGCQVGRMKVGHHGVNHPVVDPKTGVGEISAQNHSYGITSVTENVRVVHINLNDKTIEKIQSKDGSCIATMYFPLDERGKLAPGYQYV